MNNRTPLFTGLIVIGSFFLLTAFLGYPSANPPESKPESVAEYGLLCLKNELPNPVLYSYRWGNGAWQQQYVQAYSSYSHWYEYSGHEHVSPNFEIYFDSDFGHIDAFRNYNLKRVQAHFTNCEYGYEYCFRWRDSDGCFDLYDCNGGRR